MSKCAQKNPGTLVISLDFEMFWGMADVSTASNLASSMRARARGRAAFAEVI